ncbi:hypothetical protein D8674_013933 [Pyrus ussuriensis x Pyrus communis]|uniref:Uncharacterized protein n=1 Tax=Pyrus ussuriensis x Pyrus communis TaxID=2448454 RepID=A0A5N5H4K6_9ROSA|nr:hypothetical protein D8674_013933 [Pyrus ussuriensis x Pyrus communis]
MTGFYSHPRCESSGGGLEPRLFAVLLKNGRKTRGLLEQDEIGGGFDLEGVGRDDSAPCLHNVKGRESA